MKKLTAMHSIISVFFLLILANCTQKETNVLIGNWHKTDTTGINTFYINITDNSNYTTGYNNGSGYVQTGTGSYTYSTSSAIFTDAAGTCAGVPGNYNYSASGNSMTFSLISDACVNGTPRWSVVIGAWNK